MRIKKDIVNRFLSEKSALAYLLGASEINPLPPHYYCEKCNYPKQYAEMVGEEDIWEAP